MRRMTCWLVLVALATAGAAWAEVPTFPIRVRMARPERLAAPDREFTAVITFEAARAIELRGLVLAGDGWTGVRCEAPRDLAIGAGQTLDFALAATPRAGCGPLMLTAEIDGRPWRQTFRLTPEDYGGLLPTDSDLLPPERIFPATGEKFPTPPQFTLAEMQALARAEVRAPAGEKSRTDCTVTGNICYWHGTQNRWLPSYGSHVMGVVYVDGAIPPYYYTAVAETDELGRFSFTVPAGARFAIRFNATSRAARLQEDGIWEDEYKWQTAIVTLAPDQTQYDAGPLYPSHHHGALHICTDVTYSHDYFRDLGWDVSRIDVQWPDDDGSAYSPYFEEMHIERDDAWDDGTVCHEWGHYWHSEYAHTVEVDYCNGICDDGDDCGHCGWCPEEDEVAWIEGCAQILSRLLTDDLASRVMFNVSHKGIDTYHDDPDCSWQPWNIEFVVAGAIYDMADDDTGTETSDLSTDYLGNPVYDQLDLTTNDILHIMADDCAVEGHEPYRMPAFFTCAAAYLDGLGSPTATREMLWETVWAWDLQLDDAAPGVVPNLTSTFPEGTPTQTAVGGFYWQRPSDDLSGACGYSVQLSQNFPLNPDHVIDTTNLQWWPDDALAPGTYYFTVVAVDRAGNWCGTYNSHGPIIITAPGPADLTPITPTGWTAPLVLRSTLAPQAPTPVTQPTNVQGHTVYFNWGELNQGTGPTGNFRDRMYLDGTSVHTSGSRYLGAGVSNSSRNDGPVDLGAIGRHTVWVRLDGLDSSPEADENNNIYAKQFVFSPEDIALGETIVRAGGLPEATAGQSLLPDGTPFYPNGDGFDVELCIFPELVWAVPDNPNDRLTLRLHARDVGQTGFREALATAASLADRPAAILQNTAETLMTSYCIGVSDEQGSGNTYRIHRELGQMFAMPDTIPGLFDAANCLDFYYTYNELAEPAWFTIKLANNAPGPVMMRFFAPGFAMGNLSAADVTLAAAGGDTVHHNLRLEPGQMALTVVNRDPRLTYAGQYRIFAYVEKPDLEAATPATWFANAVPHVGKPYNPTQGSVPAPTRLAGDVDSTGVYWSLRNASLSAGVPTGLSRKVEVDGAQLAGSIFIEPLAPGQEVRAVQSALFNVRGGRHALTHRINSTHGIDEDDYTDNDHGRQWVWSPRVLALGQNHSLPLPAPAYGGLTHVDEGLVSPNCDGFKFTNSVSIAIASLFTAYVTGSAADIDVGLYTSADVQSGFTTAHELSTWSGTGCDFVLRCTTGIGTFTNLVGVSRPASLAYGSVALRAQASTVFWANPVGGTRTGTVEATTYFDTQILTLPAGTYRFTLQSDSQPLGFSLHDVSNGYSAKSSPWQEGLAWQEPSAVGEDVSFVVEVPAPAPARFGLVVWRPDGTTLAQDAPWVITCNDVATGVDDDDPALPAITASRLVSAAPNPFNPMTEIAFEIAQPGRCELTVHDVRGRLVRTLVAGDLPAGRFDERWDGLDDSGQRVSSGIYMARLRTARGEADLLKLTLVK